MLSAVRKCVGDGDWWRALLYGQLISLFVTGTGVCSQLLAQKYNVDIPTTQSFLNYALLAIVYSIILFGVRKENFWTVVKQKTLFYLPIALIDVEANYLVVKAYQYTSITSVMLLDCFTIPVALGLTWFFLKTKYNWRHLLGVGACLAGLIILVYDDAVKNNSNTPGSNPLKGDILCLVAATLYAISNVGQEATVKKFSREEFLSMIGIYGTIINGIQLVILERDEIPKIVWSGPVIGLMLGFAAFLFAMYSVVPYMLRLSGSTLFNLSLLTSDAYAIIFGMFFFAKVPSWLYFLALAIIIAGLLCYNVWNEPISATPPTLPGYDQICDGGISKSETNSEESGALAPSLQDDSTVVSLNADVESETIQIINVGEDEQKPNR